jgi:hypothetical protein
MTKWPTAASEKFKNGGAPPTIYVSEWVPMTRSYDHVRETTNESEPGAV